MNIRDMSRKYGVTMDTLRYYEKMELIGKTDRTGNRRVYDEKECKELEFIMIARSAGIPIDLLKKFMIANREETTDVTEKKVLVQEEIDYLKENMRKEQLFMNKLSNMLEKYEKVIEARIQKEQEKLEKEKTKEEKLEQERLEKEKAKEEKRLAREKAKEEARLAKIEARMEKKRAARLAKMQKNKDEE